ncbi:MAG: HAD hydrolase-like protein [Atopobium sp.]|nr:HAD hydrolase-like protein [Atopobium sp.]
MTQLTRVADQREAILGCKDVSCRPCVIFDFDGTLADTMPSIVNVAREVLCGFGFAEGELGDLRRLVGPPFPQAFSDVYGLSASDAAEVTRRYRAIYGSLGPEAWPAFAGMPQLLGDLQAAGRVLAVASSKRDQLLKRCVKDARIESYFSLVCGKQDDRLSSKSVTIGTVLSELGLQSKDAVMVGDRCSDGKAAREAGMPCVGVYFGDTAPAGELEQAGACAIAHNVVELGDILLG